MRVLIADDHPFLRQGLRSFVETQPGYTVCGEAVDGWEAVEMATKLHPDIVLLDISMPRLNGLEAARQIHLAVESAAIYIITHHDPQQVLPEAQRVGARGCVGKGDLIPGLANALKQAMQERTTARTPASGMAAEL